MSLCFIRSGRYAWSLSRSDRFPPKPARVVPATKAYPIWGMFETKLRKIVSQNDLELNIHAFVSSRLDYCNSLFSCLNKKELSRLQLVQNSAARILTRSNRRTHISPILKALHWLPVSSRINFKILVLTFRALHGQAPPYISDLIQPYTPARALRSVDQNLLMVPCTRFRTRGD